MLIVSGAYKIKEGKRDEFMKVLSDEGIPEENRREYGNIGYDYYYPVGNETDVYFIERWLDRDSWEAHKVAPHVIKLQGIKEKYMTGFEPGLLGELIVTD
jgi:quinol monooxygenase YgiN